MSLDLAIAGDDAQEFLVPFLKATQEQMGAALRELDPGAQCSISSAADLGFPSWVIRLAGGFTTGCLVQWSSSVPVIPIDTVAAADISSLFVLDSEAASAIDADVLTDCRQRVTDDSTYVWNFDRSNHLIAYAHRRSDGAPVLVMHSSEAEFDTQANGLFPSEKAWYMDDVRCFSRTDGIGGQIRLLIGERAKLFAEISSHLIGYAEDRHSLIAELLLGDRARVVERYHKPHFYMPTRESIALGCYVCDESEIVPVFSSWGRDIDMFECLTGGVNVVDLPAEATKYLIPHGWGRTILSPVRLHIDAEGLRLNDKTYGLGPFETFNHHPELAVRTFEGDPTSGTSLYGAIRNHTKGRVVDSLRQVWSYSVHGFARHDEVPRAGSVK